MQHYSGDQTHTDAILLEEGDAVKVQIEGQPYEYTLGITRKGALRLIPRNRAPLFLKERVR